MLILSASILILVAIGWIVDYKNRMFRHYALDEIQEEWSQINSLVELEKWYDRSSKTINSWRRSFTMHTDQQVDQRTTRDLNFLRMLRKSKECYLTRGESLANDLGIGLDTF